MLPPQAPLALRGEDVLGNPIQNRKFQRLGLTSLLVLKAMQRVRPYLKLPFQAQATEGTVRQPVHGEHTGTHSAANRSVA